MTPLALSPSFSVSAGLHHREQKTLFGCVEQRQNFIKAGQFSPSVCSGRSFTSVDECTWRRSACSRDSRKGKSRGFKGLESFNDNFHVRKSLFSVCHEKNDLRGGEFETDKGENEAFLSSAQLGCWAVTAIYVGWLFILPYAPGDPVWAISPATIQMLIDLSLNFFFVLPLTAYLGNLVGIHGLAPVLHPVDEGLFNFVIGWTLLFAPLLFTDRKRDRFGGSLEGLWLIQMLLTNTVLAPYMAIRLNRENANRRKKSWENTLGRALKGGAKYVGLVGATVGVVSVLWGLFGRPEGGFGGIKERWGYLLEYIGRERLAYAFIWDIILYTVFQPWLIGDNLSNVREENREFVRVLRFVPYVGLFAYVLGLREEVKKV
ncbi:hypothetical protein R1flu_017822 [Riccia fluitans]|uniref:Transmembrane protein n=1 Tax=Riccia fluitans TaxID=41844 RepID=A0ABD1ZE24_9MARC